MFEFRHSKSKPSPYRVAGRLVYWIAKIGCIIPIHHNDDIGPINEKFAILTGLGFLQKSTGKKFALPSGIYRKTYT